MHRILTVDGLRQSQAMRVTSSLAYLAFSASGALLLISDMLIPAYGPLAGVMAWFMLVGGLLSAVGAITLRWFGEFTGLPLLGTSLVVFGMEVWFHGFDTSPWIASGNLALLIGMALYAVTRWRQVLATYWVARIVARGRHE